MWHGGVADFKSHLRPSSMQTWGKYYPLWDQNMEVLIDLMSLKA